MVRVGLVVCGGYVDMYRSIGYIGDRGDKIGGNPYQYFGFNGGFIALWRWMKILDGI